MGDVQKWRTNYAHVQVMVDAFDLWISKRATDLIVKDLNDFLLVDHERAVARSSVRALLSKGVFCTGKAGYTLRTWAGPYKVHRRNKVGRDPANKVSAAVLTTEINNSRRSSSRITRARTHHPAYHTG